MSTSLHIFSPDSSDGHPSESRFTQAAPSNKASAKSMTRPFKFLAPNVARTLPPIRPSLPGEESFPPLRRLGVSNESPDLRVTRKEAQPGDPREGEVRNGTRGVTLGARAPS